MNLVMMVMAIEQDALSTARRAGRELRAMRRL